MENNQPHMEQFTLLTEKVLKFIEEMMCMNERNEKLRKFNDRSKKIDEQIQAQRRNKSTTYLGYVGNNNIEARESSKDNSLKFKEFGRIYPKGNKPTKPTCYYYGKKGNMSNVCWFRQLSPIKQCTFDEYYNKFHLYDHTAQTCISHLNEKRIDGN